MSEIIYKILSFPILFHDPYFSFFFFFICQNNSLHTIDLSTKLMTWSRGSSNWENAFKEIITADSYLPQDTTIQTIQGLFRPCNIIATISFLLVES